MQSYEERATQQEKVGGPKPSETNKFTQARISSYSMGFPSEPNMYISPTCPGFLHGGIKLCLCLSFHPVGQGCFGSFHGVYHGKDWCYEKVDP